MKKWSGGTLIVLLALVLFLRYSFMDTPSQKQSASSFFKSQSTIVSHVGGNHIARGPRLTDASNRLNKAQLFTIEGIDDLYSLTNISEHDSRVKLVWDQMRYLISRSDSLAETAQGVKEASIAWKDLVLTLEKEKSSLVMNNRSNSDNIVVKNCSYSVSALNFTSTREGNLLEFPCGLVQDSSITVVGIPHGDHVSFQFELISSQLPGETEPAIILLYNVSLQGDKHREGPVIVQNTWSSESGWGEEERCPAHGSSGNLKVDGLICCNEQVGETVVEETVNQTLLPSKKPLNVSKGHAHMSVNFPFLEGHPFTATLWVGLEGFHMTVNGRHETSFTYRKNLEPWLVSGLRVAGGMDVLSTLANGLPVFEDPDLVFQVQQLKAPSVPKRRLFMLVGVFSTGNNFERRMALRRSWMQYKAIRSGDVAVRFFIGLHKNKQVNVELWKEAQKYGDVQLMPFVDYYSLITLKTIALSILGTKILPAKYIMKADDDAFVRIDEVLSILREKKISEGLLYGLISFQSEPHRDQDSKWYISLQEWPHASYPPWAHGPGYIISRDIAKFIVRGHQEGDLKNEYEVTVKAIRETKKLTDKAFGAGVLLEFNSTKTIRAIFDEKLACLEVFWGDFPKEMVDEAHKHGIKVIHQVGSVKAAERAIAAGVDCIIAQGVEAGGHIAGTVSLMALLPRILDAVGHRNIPVVAAGSIVDARGYVAALSMGAEGICVGTRFVATKESYANDYYKQQLLHYTENETDRTDLYGRLTWRAFVRCLNTPFHKKWRNAPDDVQNDETQPIIGYSTIYWKEVVLRRFAGQVANRTTVGELEDMVMLAGQGVGLLKDIVPAAEVIRRYVEGAKAIIQGLGEKYLEDSAPPTPTTPENEKWTWVEKCKCCF